MNGSDVEKFMKAYEKTDTVVFGARRYSHVENVVYIEFEGRAITWQELLKELGFQPAQLKEIFCNEIEGTESWEQLGSIPLNRGDLFGKLTRLIGKTIEVARDTGMDNIISGSIWTCHPDGRVVESEKWPWRKYWTA